MRKSIRYSAIALISGVLMLTGTASAYASSGGTINSGGGNVNLRSGPGTGFSILGTIANGTAVSIDCVGYGTAVTGPFGTTTLWDEIGNRRWVSDAFVNTGTNLPIAMPCHTGPLGPGSGDVYTSVLLGGECDSNTSGAGTNFGSVTTGPDWFQWFQVAGVCDPSNNLSFTYTYGNGPNPSGHDYARWGYYPGAGARCDIWVHIPYHPNNLKPFTNQARYQVFTGSKATALLFTTWIDQALSQAQDVYLGAFIADGSGRLRVQMDDSSDAGNASQIVVANEVHFSCTSSY